MAEIKQIREMNAAERDRYAIAQLQDMAHYLRDDMSVEDFARIIAIEPCVAGVLVQVTMIISNKFQELKTWEAARCVMGSILRGSRPRPDGDAA